MRTLKSRLENGFYWGYRLIEPVWNPVISFRGLSGYYWYLKDLIRYKELDPKPRVLANLYPRLHDRTNLTPFDAHYFYQQLWVFEKILGKKPKKHIDVGSTYQMSGYLSKIVPTEFVDIRPINSKLKNLKTKFGNILKLPFPADSLESLSCLHVAEHIGLGRYGDSLDPLGTEKACHELTRVLKPGGFLYFSIPIGKPRVCFNAHRIFSPIKILTFFSKLYLVEFSVIDDDGKFIQKTKPEKFKNLVYGCGLFLFTKKT